MSTVLFLFVIGVGVVFVLLGHDKKVFHGMVLSMTFLLMGTNFINADYFNYEAMYNAAVYADMEDVLSPVRAMFLGMARDPGYALLNYIGNIVGLDYSMFRLITSCFYLLLLYQFIIKYKVNTSLVLVLYLIYPFLMDIIQVRNFFIESLLICAMYLYIKNPGVRGKWEYVIFLLIAGMFHSFAFLYIPFILFDRWMSYRYLKYICYMFIALGLFMPIYADYIMGKWPMFLTLFLSYDLSGLDHYAGYLGTGTLIKYIDSYGLLVLMTVMVYVFNRIHIIRENTDAFHERMRRVLFRFFLYMMCFLPFVPVFTELGKRGARNLLIFFFVLIADTIRNRGILYRSVFFVVGIAMALLFGRMDLYSPSIVFNVYDLFEYNLVEYFFSLR